MIIPGQLAPISLDLPWLRKADCISPSAATSQGIHLQLVMCGDTFGIGHNERYFRLNAFDDRLGGYFRGHEDRNDIGP
jgi:hypothetical protein